jgi:RHS repeat-associated protein
MQTFIYDSIPRFVRLYTFNPSRYTGKERDTESGLDYFGARYYGSSMGRFMSPDPVGIFVADVTNPQSWNLYSYVMNNPLKFIDPSGEECVWDDGSYDAADDKQTGSASGCTGQGGTYFPPSIFEGVQGNQAGSWSGQANSSIVSNWLNPSVTVFGGPNAAQQEVNNDVSKWFNGTSPPNIVYLPQDPSHFLFRNPLEWTQLMPRLRRIALHKVARSRWGVERHL